MEQSVFQSKTSNIIPEKTFSKFDTQEYEGSIVAKRRYDLTIDFIKESSRANFTLCLDIGTRNTFTAILEKELAINKIQNTKHDLDRCYGPASGKYTTIFCFEVIEHVMNPLALLDWIRKNLSKDDGTLFLSTPVAKPRWLWPSGHFSEYDRTRMAELLKKSGLSIQRQKTLRIVPFLFALRGFRPILRYLFFGKTQIYELTR